MNFGNISIIGIGLMGSSFALALKNNGFRGSITGVGRNRKNLAKAKRLGIIDQYTTNHVEGVQEADLILLATPVGQFESIVRDIGDHLKKGAIVTDLGSVKAAVVKKLDSLMPEGVHFVGAHPIAGKECSGISGATADLFTDARCILTPGKNTSVAALRRIRKLWKLMGARTITMTPEEHDLIYAAVSHVPHVVAYALVNSIMNTRDDILRYGGRGLKDMTRIAASPSTVWRDICALNRKEILRSLRKFSTSLSRMTRYIEKSDWSRLEKEFKKAKEARDFIDSA